MTITRSDIAGHEAFTVAGRRLSLTCVPSRGGHLTSIRQDGHEWLWAPPGGPRLGPVDAAGLFDPHEEGCDDCLPTVMQDVVAGVHYEDHGAVWHRPWRILAAVDRLVLRIDLPTCGLTCERSMAADGDGLRLDWRLVNPGDRPVPYIWCWHPLFAWRPGDRLELPGAGACLRLDHGTLVPGAWPRPLPDVDLSTGDLSGGSRCKSYIACGGLAVLRSASTALALRWDPLVLPWAGLWIKHVAGQDQWAVEPSNVATDHLGQLPAHPREAVLPARGERSWSIRLSPA